MPLPDVKLFLKISEYMPECIKAQEGEEITDEQKIAICYAEWEKLEKESKEEKEEIEETEEMSKDKKDLKMGLELSTGSLSPSLEWQTIKVLPLGRVYLEKYKQWFEFSQSYLQEIVANLNNKDLPSLKLDKNHDYKENYADFKNPVLKDDGLYLDIRLNNEGVRLVKEGLYKSISPTIKHEFANTDGKVYKNVMIGISLTNFPVLGNTIPELPQQMQLALELPENKIELALEKINAIKAEKIELANKVESLEKRLNEIELANLQDEAKNAVNKALELGKIHPALREKYIARYVKDKQDVISEFALLPEKKSEILTAQNSIKSKIELSAKDETDMRFIGLDPESDQDRQTFFDAIQKNRKK